MARHRAMMELVEAEAKEHANTIYEKVASLTG